MTTNSKSFQMPKPNEYLKELGAACLVLKTSLSKENSEKENRPKKGYQRWEVFMTHTARRSFITNALLAGIAPHQIMKMTGHSNMRTFEAYIKFNEKYNAIQLSTDPFFTKLNFILSVNLFPIDYKLYIVRTNKLN